MNQLEYNKIMNDAIIEAADVVWNYMTLNQPVEAADCLLVLGSRDDRVAVYAAEVSKIAQFENIVISGGLSHTQDMLATGWGDVTEAAHFKAIFDAHQDKGSVLIEHEAGNTGENAHFSYNLLKKHHIEPKSLLLVTKPYMERRALATFQKQWPRIGTSILVTSPGGSLQDYVNDEQPIDLVINIMVGDLQRIIEYPKRGLQVEQFVSNDVIGAYELLITAGYSQHMIN